MKFVTSGTTRLVLQVNGIAVKIPKNFSGLKANRQEIRLCRQGQFKGLCPILLHVPFGLLVIMKRARVLNDSEFDSFDYVGFVFQDDKMLPAEPTTDSFGFLEEKIVCVDYGA